MKESNFDISTVKGRILTFIGHLGIPVSAFEKECGMANATIANMRKSLSQSKVNDIALKYPQLNIDWVLMGRGEMLNNNAADMPHAGENEIEDLRRKLRYRDERISALLETVDAQKTTIKALSEQISMLKESRA